MARRPRRAKIQPGSEALRLLLATLLTLPAADRPALIASSSLRPNLAPSFCDAGAGEPFALQRTFQLPPQFQTAARNPRLNRADAYLQRLRNLFVAKPF